MWKQHQKAQRSIRNKLVSDQKPIISCANYMSAKKVHHTRAENQHNAVVSIGQDDEPEMAFTTVVKPRRTEHSVYKMF